MKCPQCHGLTELDEKSCSCGWRAASKTSTGLKLCVWNDHGMPCGYPGSISDQIGANADFYCREHYADLHHRPRWTVEEEDMSQSAVDERVNKIVPRKAGESEHAWSMRCREYVLAFVQNKIAQRPKKSWAYELIAKAERGEYVRPYSLALAREAVPYRQPGEDQVDT